MKKREIAKFLISANFLKLKTCVERMIGGRGVIRRAEYILGKSQIFAKLTNLNRSVWDRVIV